MIDIVDQLTGMGEQKRTELARRYGAMTEAERLLVHARHTDIIRINQDRLKDKSQRGGYYYATFLLAIAAAEASAPRLRVPAKPVNKAIAKRPKKKKIKITRAQLWPWIMHQREEGYSWRDISAQLRKEHHFRIGERYLAELTAEVAAEKKLKELKEQGEGGQK